MGRMPSAERRRQLVEAAIRAMTRDGVARTTTRSICAEAGVSLSVFHYCFESKQALLEAAIETINANYVARVMSAVEPGATLRETVRGALQSYWDHVTARPGEHMLTYDLTQYALREPGFEHLARAQYEQYALSAGALVEQVRAMRGLEPRVPVETVARYLAAAIDGLTLQFLVLSDEKTATDLLDLTADQLVSLIEG
ncbi:MULTISPECIES: TetR/AcrR family transcriptional regulator [Streptomyces]|uniref:Transcriptional regulator, TetR family n=1 Tax=Streptomyces venezuelae (strain ATCC 10712 / CBS 650.69 / DSM 40230 / JCM 4526 / NBRC 13096 / PD 04745) TaxID=953739 RepID=F2R5W8_STRVP|nr:TetR/AcrR family transcriptional regulator [Streptomyces venezuelae]APE19823.1 TetR family transcriptional regulator [Streptomyces venezuelae]QER97232.1 TetR family transcriptional regulator [Streptomyces venezuelae ATCC 10712]QES04423.1 TetR family transcriptional regulator [Streptomyces venezuelae]QES16836.1 TetR family transcriptional regulator [Streptomyces venezuelae]CCA53629.1 Transcriptional regulator, TetR family [Streptomyces venezuelae ATCC 10712]